VDDGDGWIIIACVSILVILVIIILLAFIVVKMMVKPGKEDEGEWEE